MFVEDLAAVRELSVGGTNDIVGALGLTE